MKIIVGKEFAPSKHLKKLYFVYMFSFVALLTLPWIVPVAIFAPAEISSIIMAAAGIPVVAVLVFTAWWIGRYYNSVVYKLTSKEITWKRGVWFRKTGIVPYNRITNVDIYQGPVSRKFGIASLKIQTAGYSGPASSLSEIRMDGIEDFEEMRHVIMNFVDRTSGTGASGSFLEEDSKIISELAKIRKILEKTK